MSRDAAPTRRSILDAVGRIVATRGLEGIRIREIAAEAHLSPGSVLYHFPDQAELLLAVHEDIVRTYVEGRRGARERSALPREQLLDVARAGIPPWADEHVIRLLYEMHGLAGRSAPHAELLAGLWRAELATYTEIVAAGIADGDFRTAQEPEEVATQLLALEDGLVLHAVSGNPAFDGDLMLHAFASVARSLLDCDRIGGAASADGRP